MITTDLFLLMTMVSGFSLLFCLGTNLYFMGQATGRATVPSSRHLKWAWGLSIGSLLIPYAWPISAGILVWRRYKKWDFLEETADASLERWTRITLIWVGIQHTIYFSFLMAWVFQPQG